MAEYLGRTGSCTEGRFHPDTNLTAYARSNGFQTALVGARFKGTNKIYTYWGHTGMQRGDYARVLVPRSGSRQEEVVVRIVAVIPAAELKQANGRTAKHIQSVLIGHIPPSLKIPLPSDPFTQSWRNATSFDVVPAPPTEHAKACVEEIDYVLGDGIAGSFKTGPLANADLSGLELRVTADAELVKRGESVHRQFEHYMAMQDVTSDEFKAMYQQKFVSVPSKEDRITDVLDRATYPVLPPGLSLADVPRDVIESIIKEYPAVGAGRPKTFRPSYLTDLGPCGRETTQETIVSAKIQNVVYVTLPGSTTRFVASEVKAEAYFEAIAALEAQIAKLEKISTKPVSLQQQIEELKGQVQQLADLCDSFYAKKEPILDQAEQSEAKDSTGDANSYIAARARD